MMNLKKSLKFLTIIFTVSNVLVAGCQPLESRILDESGIRTAAAETIMVEIIHTAVYQTVIAGANQTLSASQKIETPTPDKLNTQLSNTTTMKSSQEILTQTAVISTNTSFPSQTSTLPVSSTVTHTATFLNTKTSTLTPTITFTMSPTQTRTSLPTITTTRTATSTATKTSTSTVTPTRSITPTKTFTTTATFTPTITASPTRTNTPTRKPTLKPTITPIPDPLIFNGEGDFTLDIKKWNDPGFVHITNTGINNFIVWNFDSEGNNIDLLVNTVGDYDGSIPVDFLFNKQTSGFLITSDGEWTIEVYPINEEYNQTITIPGTYIGNGDDVVVVLGNPTFAQFSVPGTGIFMVWTYTMDSGMMILYEKAPYYGYVNLDKNYKIIAVNSQSKWTLQVK